MALLDRDDSVLVSDAQPGFLAVKAQLVVERMASPLSGRVVDYLVHALQRRDVDPLNLGVRFVLVVGDASQGVARVVSDVSVLCPRLVVCSYNRAQRMRMH